MAGRRVHFVMPDDLVSRIDAACSEGVSRGEFVRRAVEQALGDRIAPVQAEAPLAPAEQPVTQAEAEVRESEPRSVEEALTGVRPYRQGYGPNVQNVRSSSQSKRDVRPIPKKGEPK